MQKITLILLLVIVVILGLAGAFFFFRDAEPTSQVPGTNQFPIQNPTSTTTSGSFPKLLIARSGVSVRDFITDKTAIEDPISPGSFIIAIDKDQCSEGYYCTPTSQADGFNIVYDSTSQSFTIAITDEPIGTNRRKAEAFLAQVLQVQATEICKLDVLVTTTSYVSALYGGEELGISFCPGSIPLPE